MTVKNLSNRADRESLAQRLADLSPEDTRRWGSMTVHQMVCHVEDSYKVALGEKAASPATGSLQRTVLKWLALHMPLRWPKGVPTRPEVEQGKGGSVPGDFREDVTSLLCTVRRFCDELPSPRPIHPIFGKMSAEDWMRWGYLHADHHLRQFGR
jgi:DinB superfamily